MAGRCELAELSASELFRESIRDGGLVALEAAVAALDAQEFSDSERVAAKSALLALCFQCHPGQMVDAVDLMLANGARPDLPFEESVRPLPGMRPGMVCASLTPMGIAIDRGNWKTVEKMLRAIWVSHEGPDQFGVIPPAGQLRVNEGSPFYDANILAFASACGQTEMVQQIIDVLDTNAAEVRRAMGMAVDTIIATGLLQQGPDSILADVVRLISHGAILSPYSVSELSEREIKLDNGADLGWAGPWKYAPFAALAMISALPPLSVAVEDVVTVLYRLQEDCDVNLATVTLAHFHGANLRDVADRVGSQAITDHLIEAGCARISGKESGHVRVSLPEMLGDVHKFADYSGVASTRGVGFSPHIVSSDSGSDKQDSMNSALGLVEERCPTTSAELFYSLKAAQGGRRRSMASLSVVKV